MCEKEREKRAKSLYPKDPNAHLPRGRGQRKPASQKKRKEKEEEKREQRKKKKKQKENDRKEKGEGDKGPIPAKKKRRRKKRKKNKRIKARRVTPYISPTPEKSQSPGQVLLAPKMGIKRALYTDIKKKREKKELGVSVSP